VVVAHLPEQHFWGEILRVRRVAGAPLTRQTLTSHDLAQAVNAVVTSPAMARAANALGKRVRKDTGVSKAIAMIEARAGALRPLLELARARGAWLVYWFGSDKPPADIVSDFHGRRITRSIRYAASFAESHVPSSTTPDVTYGSETVLDASILAIARHASEFSRFRLDDRLRRECADRLYEIWIERALKREIAEEVVADAWYHFLLHP